MNITEIKEYVTKQAENIDPFGGKLKFDIDGGTILLDGTGEKNVVTSDDVDADCVLIMNSETFEKLQNGSLNAVMAVMGGALKIKGDMSLAMKLQSVLE